jgi:hypothetical protein
VVLVADRHCVGPSYATVHDGQVVSYATDFLQPQRVAHFAFFPLKSVEMTA